MKTYLPTEDINSNWKYRINDDYYLIITNQNCYTQYNTTYCDCYYRYPKNDYIRSETQSCNWSSTNSWIPSSYFTDDYWYRLDLSNILIIFIILFIFGIYFPYRVINRIFGRWLKI